MDKVSEWFCSFSKKISEVVGSFWSFGIAAIVVIVWALTGPIFGFSDTWQLIINTGTTIVTFLVVFLIQNTQNRDSKAIHLKLDELISVTQKARNELIEAERMPDKELKEMDREFIVLAKKGDNGTAKVPKRKKEVQEKARRSSARKKENAVQH